MALDVPLIRDPKADVVDAGALRLTLGTQVGAGIVALVTALNPLFGDSFRPGLKTAVIIAAIAAFTLLGAADVLARAQATCCSRPPLALAPEGLDAKYTPLPGDQEAGWTVVAMRPKAGEASTLEFLISKRGQAPQWAETKDLEFT